jgi:hypothetical protein
MHLCRNGIDDYVIKAIYVIQLITSGDKRSSRESIEGVTRLLLENLLLKILRSAPSSLRLSVAFMT